MAIQFSGGTIVDTVFVSNGTRGQLVSQWEAALVAAGWTAISGAGTSDPIYQSATAQGFNKVRFEFKDPGSGNCAQMFLRSDTLVSTIPGFMLPVGGQPFRIWANKYSFFMFRSSPDTALQRCFLCGGTLWLPDFILDWMQDFPYLGWLHGIGTSDTDGTAIGTTTWRRAPCSVAPVYGQMLWRNLLVNAGFGNAPMPLWGNYIVGNSAGGGVYAASQWDDGTFHLLEPLLLHYQVAQASNVYAIKGQLYDAVMTSKRLDGETVRQIGNRSWRTLTHQVVTEGTASVSTGGGTLMLLTNTPA